MTAPSSLYVGKAGHLALMGEFCYRGYNVAMPEIDKGDDIFVVNDATGAMWRVQAKTSSGSTLREGRRKYQFRVREDQILTSFTPELHFVFIMRKHWIWHFLVMDRAVLRNYLRSDRMGSSNGGYRIFAFILQEQPDGQRDRCLCGATDLSRHLEDWATWPRLSS